MRSKERCSELTLDKATCLPVEELLASRQRVANFSGLLWKLGTADLVGDEHVLVVGESIVRKDVIAGILHLAGQRQISILVPNLSELISTLPESRHSKGVVTSSTRRQVWQAPMRSENIVLHDEMLQLVSGNRTLILDGRSDAEYWGQTIKAHRGGHIPGADLNSYNLWLPVAGNSDSSNITMPVANDQPATLYAADAYTVLAFYTRVISNGIVARVYLDGWLRWAAHMELPIDAASYGSRPDSAVTSQHTKVDSPLRQQFSLKGFSQLLWVVLVAIAFICGYIVSRISQRRTDA